MARINAFLDKIMQVCLILPCFVTFFDVLRYVFIL